MATEHDTFELSRAKSPSIFVPISRSCIKIRTSTALQCCSTLKMATRIDKKNEREPVSHTKLLIIFRRGRSFFFFFPTSAKRKKMDSETENHPMFTPKKLMRILHFV